MNITTFSDYSLRVLIFLASNKKPKVTSKHIADTHDISFHHIAKTAQWLTREGYITSERGRTGGLSLKQKPETINIGDLLMATEKFSGAPLVDCFKETGGSCMLRKNCGLKSALSKAQSAFYSTLSGYTLADITQGPDISATHRQKSPTTSLRLG